MAKNVAAAVATVSLAVVRSTNVELGKRYLVDVHGVGQKWMKATQVPSVPLSQMTQDDSFIFETANGKTSLELKTHGTGGPQFLVAKVPGKRGNLVNARVTFYMKEKAAKTAPAPVTKKATKKAA